MPSDEALELPMAEFRTKLADCVSFVARGGTVTVTSHGKPVARLVAPEPVLHMPWGALRGQVRMADDFDELPADIIDAIENGPV